MAKHTNLTSLFTDIADAIRSKKGTTNEITADNFPDEIANIEIGITPSNTVEIFDNGTFDVTDFATVIVSVEPVMEELTVTENGVYIPDEADGYSKVIVDVANTSYPMFGGYFDDNSVPITGNVDYDQNEATLYITDTEVDSVYYENAQMLTYNDKPLFRLYVDGELVWEMPHEATLSDNTWETISAIAKMGVAPLVWNIGDQTTISIDGVSYTVDIIGFDHDDVADPITYGRAKAGITFQIHDLCDTSSLMPSGYAFYSGGGWQNTEMRTSILPSLLSTLDNDVSSKIVTVNKISGTGDGPINTTITEDDLFLLSAVEIFGMSIYSDAGSTFGNLPALTEGFQYEYYSQGNSPEKHFPDGNYVNTSWWTRSAAWDNEESSSKLFSYVSTSGKSIHVELVSNGKGIAFGFCV